MGAQKRYIRYIEKHAKKQIGGLERKSMLELGNQILKGDIKKESGLKTGKQYFTNKGVEHISIDMNGRHGSLKHDLAKPIINPNWINYFDIITNMGTTEHVEPQSGQYVCFRNLHNFLKVDGIAIHILPDILERRKDNFSVNHANNYYKEEFFRELAGKDSGYELIDLSRKKYNLFICMKKVYERPFMKDKDLFFSNMIRQEGGKIWRGINDRV